MSAIISIRNVSKRFGAFTALDDVSLDIEEGQFFCLLGPSGCGKTTLLRMIAGFEQPSEGTITLDGADITRLKPNERPVNMVFQSYAVFPHMSVEANVGYGLMVDGVARGERRERVAEALSQVQMAEFAHRKPDQLSGGQRQRVALARALVKRPRVLLLDEPLSALDAKLRDAMRLELVNLQTEVGITFVMVTHDQSEALAVADRIAVIEKGRLKQVARPEDLYRRPADSFVADFIGRINMLPASLGGGAVRPERIALHYDAVLPPSLADQPHAVGRLGDVAFGGEASLAQVILEDGHSLTAFLTGDDALRAEAAGEGAPVFAAWSEEDRLRLPS